MSEFECQAYICPWCFNDHGNLMCKTIDVKERVEKLAARLEKAEALLNFCQTNELLEEETSNKIDKYFEENKGWG